MTGTGKAPTARSQAVTPTGVPRSSGAHEAPGSPDSKGAGLASAVRFTRWRAAVYLGASAAVVLVALALAVTFGEEPISLGRALVDPESIDATIFWSLRLPRALLAILVGAALGASGSTLQALLRNPLADPFVLGVSGGAALGATLAIALGAGALPGLLAFVPIPAFAAFVGAALATALVFGLGRVSGQSSPHATLLTGVVFNAFAASAVTCVKVLSEPGRLGDILFWLAGTLGYERPATLIGAAALQAVALGILFFHAGSLNLLSLGDDDAASLGVPVTRTRAWLLLGTSLAVAGAVALSGLIGFVGLLVPHLLRLLIGPDQRLLLPASALGGAALLLLADLGARLSFGALGTAPPAGVVTALLGGPFFLWLLHRREL